MSEKIYMISCSQDLASMGLDRMRTRVEGLEEAELSLDWTKVRIVPVVAADKVPYERGETQIVPIRPIAVPEYAIVFLSLWGVNGMGHLFCIGCQTMKMYEEKRIADVCVFQSRIKASVMKGDLLGQVLIIPGKKT